MIKEKFAKLIDVKSIITFGVVGTVMFLALKGAIAPDKIFDMGLMIVGYFFGVKRGKEEAKTTMIDG